MKGSTNVLNTTIGNLADLETQDKSSLVAAINEAAAVGGANVYVDGTSADTFGSVLTRLYNAADLSKITYNAILVVTGGSVDEYYQITEANSTYAEFTYVKINSGANALINVTMTVASSGSRRTASNTGSTTSFNDVSSTNLIGNRRFTLYY